MRKDRAGKPDLPLALAGLLGQVGCVTIVIIFAALGIGLWLDSQFSSRPLFTLVLVIGSVPVTIYLMVRIVLSGMAKIQREPQVPQGSAGAEPSDSEGNGERRNKR